MPWSASNAHLRPRISTLVGRARRSRLAMVCRHSPRRPHRAASPVHPTSHALRLDTRADPGNCTLPVRLARAAVCPDRLDSPTPELPRPDSPCRSTRVPHGGVDDLLPLLPLVRASVLDAP